MKSTSTQTVFTIIGVVITLIALVFGNNFYKQLTGGSIFDIPTPIPPVVSPAIQPAAEEPPAVETRQESFPSMLSDGEVLYVDCEIGWDDCRNSLISNANWEGLSIASVQATRNGDVFTINRVFLFFDTTSIPPDAVVTSAALYLFSDQYINGNTKIHVVPSSSNIQLQPDDFSRIEFVSGGSTDVSEPFMWFSINLEESALSWIDPSGFTYLALVQDNDLRNEVPTDVNGITISTSEAEEYAPYLVVDYYLP